MELERKPKTQAELIRLLRIELAGSIDKALIARFRRLDWTNNAKTAATAEHGRESLGQEVLAEVSGTEDLPEELNLQVPVYRDVGRTTVYTVKCAVEIDTVQATFCVTPLPGQLDLAQESALTAIRDELVKGLSSTSVPIYAGNPSQAQS